MRNRQLAAAPLTEVSDTFRNGVKWGNMVGLPLLVVLIGFVRYQLAQARRRRITSQWQAERSA